MEKHSRDDWAKSSYKMLGPNGKVIVNQLKLGDGGGIFSFLIWNVFIILI